MKVSRLTAAEKTSGEVVNLFPRWHTGIIHGDDGYDVAFNDESLVVGIVYEELRVGQLVSYGVFFAKGCKVPVAINVIPARVNETETRQDTAGRHLVEEAAGRVE